VRTVRLGDFDDICSGSSFNFRLWDTAAVHRKRKKRRENEVRTRKAKEDAHGGSYLWGSALSGKAFVALDQGQAPRHWLHKKIKNWRSATKNAAVCEPAAP
jgi:hypothetical protein